MKRNQNSGRDVQRGNAGGMSRRDFAKAVALLGVAGTAAALCAQKKCGTRDLAYRDLREALLRGGGHLEG